MVKLESLHIWHSYASILGLPTQCATVANILKIAIFLKFHILHFLNLHALYAVKCTFMFYCNLSVLFVKDA